MTASNKRMDLKIINALLKYYEIAKPDLQYHNLYELTISVILSAQTTDIQVNGVTPLLFKNYPDFKDLAKARLPEVRSIIKSTGFYKNKSRFIIDLSKLIMEKYNGKLPDSREELMKLPGIGRKSANVILSMGFNKPALAVDTHIIRISQRLGFSDSQDPLKVEKSLTSFIPKDKWKQTHLVLIKHGRTLCKARNPQCGQCPVRAYCFYYNNIS